MYFFIVNLFRDTNVNNNMALFASLIIRFFQLVFLAGTIFFSHNKSAGTVFRLIFSTKRTGPISINIVKFKID